VEEDRDDLEGGLVTRRAVTRTAWPDAWWERLDQKMPQKNVLRKIISVLRSDISNVNAVLFAADRIPRCNMMSRVTR